MLITQYILNIDKKDNVYIGSGTIVISGSANISFSANYGNYQEQFYLGEWVYDLDHNVWQIVAIQGDVSNPVYVCTRLETVKEFFGYELIKFTNETSAFNTIYDEEIATYQAAIDRLDSLALMASPPAFNNFLLKFTVGEYVFDKKQDVWQIIAILGNVSKPQYQAIRLSYKKIFLENEIVRFTNQTSHFNKEYDDKIDKYAQILGSLNAITTY